MPIKPVVRSLVSNELFDQMLEFIHNGEWKPGDKIPSEAELTEKFAVSRISVREALHKLSALGLINARPGLGTFVSEFSSELYLQNLLPLFLLNRPEILQVLEFRNAIEVESAKLAAERATEEDIALLADILQSIKLSVSNLEPYSRFDLKFHNAIAEITRNPLIVKVNLLIQRILVDGFRKQTEGTRNYDVEQHQRIYEAIAAHDPDAAQAAMRDHINYTIRGIKK